MEPAEQSEDVQVTSAANHKAKPIKRLPTGRLTFEKQLSVLRAYGAASGVNRKPVSISDVGDVLADMATTSVSLCNPFFVDVGLLVRDGHKFQPSEAVIDYLHAFEWDKETATRKLSQAFENTWFANALQPKLSFRALTRDEAVTYLADEAKASKDFRRQLDMLIDYLNAAGLVSADGTTVKKIAKADRGEQPGGDKTCAPKDPSKDSQTGGKIDGMERFVLPVPGKPAAIFQVPANLDAADWNMLKSMLETYILRMQGQGITPGREDGSPPSVREGGTSL